MSKSDGDIFLELKEVPQYCTQVLGLNLSVDDLRDFASINLINIFCDDSKDYIMLNNIKQLEPTLRAFCIIKKKAFESGGLFRSDYFTRILLSNDSWIELGETAGKYSPVFYSAVYNLITRLNELERGKLIDPENAAYFPPTRIRTPYQQVIDFVNGQASRANMVSSLKSNEFANTAHYMGSKGQLAAFLVEGISSVLPEEGIVIDLMCGSGSATAAFSLFWKTYASDAQDFCRLLAAVQGGGYSVHKAERLLERILPMARKHASDLGGILETFISTEDKIFHGDIGPDLLDEYKTFVKTFPT